MIHLDSFTDSFSGALWWWVETTLFCVLWAIHRTIHSSIHKKTNKNIGWL